VVRIYDPDAGSTKEIRTLGSVIGRGSPDVDETSIWWSPDGAHLLVTSTSILDHVHGKVHSVFVIDTEGADVVPPQTGSFARWSDSGAEVFFLKISPGLSPQATRMLDVSSGSVTDLPGAVPGFRISVLPGGHALTYDDSGSTPSIYHYDLRTSSQTKLIEGAVGGRWIDDGSVLVTRTRACPPPKACFVPWEEVGIGLRVDLEGGQTPQSFLSTLDADVL
jgi:dipeptidyl aminopeptidase/acylaminoacyl peptidase